MKQLLASLNVLPGFHPNFLSCTPLQMVSDLPVITRDSCADYYGGIIYSGIMCIDAAGGKGVCNVRPISEI